nr:terminase large subunit [Salipiger sp. HF18]
MAGAELALQPWQVFRHGSVFGWKHAETGLRRFRATYHQVAKKNGKTTDTAVPMLFTQLFDGEGAPQGYCAATTRDQAGLLFNEIKRMIRGSPALSSLLDVFKTQIQSPRTNGYIAALSRDGNSADGINPHFAARDEVHRWTDRELADVVTNSMIARAQPIDWAIGDELDAHLDVDARDRDAVIHFGAVTARDGATLVGEPFPVFTGTINGLRDLTEANAMGRTRGVIGA